MFEPADTIGFQILAFGVFVAGVAGSMWWIFCRWGKPSSPVVVDPDPEEGWLDPPP